MLKFLTYKFSINLQFLLNKCLFENSRQEKLEKAVEKDDLDLANKLFSQDKMEIEQEVRLPFKEFPDLEVGDFCSSYKGSIQFYQFPSYFKFYEKDLKIKISIFLSLPNI